MALAKCVKPFLYCSCAEQLVELQARSLFAENRASREECRAPCLAPNPPNGRDRLGRSAYELAVGFQCHGCNDADEVVSTTTLVENQGWRFIPHAVGPHTNPKRKRGSHSAGNDSHDESAPHAVSDPGDDTSRHGEISQNATNEPKTRHTCEFHRFKISFELRQIRTMNRHLTASRSSLTKLDRGRRDWLPDTPHSIRSRNRNRNPNPNRNRNRNPRVAPSSCHGMSPPAPAPPPGLINTTVSRPARTTAGEKNPKGAQKPSVIYRHIPKPPGQDAHPASLVKLDNLAARAGDQGIPCRLVLLGRYRSNRTVAHRDIRPLGVCRAAVDLAGQSIFALVSG